MNYFYDLDIPNSHFVSITSTLVTSVFSYKYADNSSNCYVLGPDAYSKFVYEYNYKLITDGDYLRIFNAAVKINCTIYVVGSRANGTATEISDWDYIIEGLTNRKWKKIRNSLPGAKSIDNPITKVDLMHTPLDESKPYIAISPFNIINSYQF